MNAEKNRFFKKYDNLSVLNGKAQLRSLTSMTDKEAIDIAIIVMKANQNNFTTETKWKVSRNEITNFITISYEDKDGLFYSVDINLSNGSILANFKILGLFDGERDANYELNIGKYYGLHFGLVDYFRECNFLVGYKNYSIKDLLELGWCEIIK